MNYDITFCNRNCNNKECKRNLESIKLPKDIFVSIANFKECKNFKEKKENCL